MHRPSWMRTKRNSKPNSKASSIAVPSTSNLANEAEAELENPPEAPQPKAEPCQSLWDRAYEDLRKEKRELVDAFEKLLMSKPEIDLTFSMGNNEPSEREKQMSALVDEKLAAMNEKQWRVRVCGRSVKVREQVDWIVKVVLVAKDVISSVVSMNPVHAGLPWAEVCMLLPLVVNDTKQRSAAIEGLEYISQLVRRYTEIEHIYLQEEEPALRNDLDNAIMKLYRQVLEYQARAACQFNRNTIFQIARNIVGADSWESILDNIKTSEVACDGLKEVIDAKDQRVRTRRLENMLEKQARKVDELLKVSRGQDEELLAEIKAMRKDQQASFATQEEMNCHKSLRTTAYENTMENNSDRVLGTCEWFLQNLIYYTSVCYFFFKDDSDENKSATNALCAILHQLFIQNHALLKHAMAEYNSNGTKLPLLFGSLWSILLRAAADLNSGRIFCIIDALDECAEPSCEQLIKCLAEFHSNRNRTAKIKFHIISRPNSFIRRVFSENFYHNNQDLASVKLMRENESEMKEICSEIDLVIDAKMKDFKKERSSSYEIDDNADVAVRKQLKNVENRTYLWMALVFPEVKKMIEYGEDELLKAVKPIPSTVDEAYERILSKSTDGRKARRLLHIVCGASRPLTLREMNRALSIKENGCFAALVPPQSFGNVVRNLCGLFISIQHNRIYLIHQTAKKFLIRENAIKEPNSPVSSSNGSWKHSLEPTESNLVLAEICIQYLLFSELESDSLASDEIKPRHIEKQQVEKVLNGHDLLEYSAINWATHFRKAKSKQRRILKLALENCDTRSKRFRTWFYVYWRTNMSYYWPIPDFTDLMVGSYFGHETVVKQLLESGVDPDFKDNRYGQTSLSWAARYGHAEVVKLLLAMADVASDSKDNNGRTPLSWAAGNGSGEVVKLLLAMADVASDSKDNHDRTPLMWAAGNGSGEVVKLLLANVDVDPNAKDNRYGRTLLSWAARRGHEEVVKLLLAKADVDPNSSDEDGQTPLWLAAENGHEEVVKLLLAKAEVDPNSRDNRFGRTLLSWAAINGHAEVVKLLLAMADVASDSKDNNDRTPLSLAAENGREEVVKLLLANVDVDSDSKDKNGRAPLSWAEENGNEEVVKLLLAKNDGTQIDACLAQHTMTDSTS